jgi:isopenicillin-N epimerase
MIVISHISSPTAVILPVAEICARGRERGIAVAIDGPHAVAQLPLDIDRLGCDFYAASCHKWLSAPFGSGFLYVAPRQQQQVRPHVLSWGRLPPGRVESWADEFTWSGTRNPAAYLSVPAAIEFLERVGLETFRTRTHWLAQYARRRLVELTQLEPLVPDDPAWYGSMAHVPLSPTTTNETCAVSNPLQHVIWQQLGIEVPIVDFRGHRYIRVSCHLYNDTAQIDRLVGGLGDILAAH